MQRVMKTDAERVKPHNVTLAPADAERLRELGRGNLSAGIRAALDCVELLHRTLKESLRAP